LPGVVPTTPDTRLNPSRITTESFILGAEYEVAPNIGVGARLPFTFGNFTPEGLNSRGTTALGALEVEGAYTYRLNPQMKLIGALGVSLPTAQGDEVPGEEGIDHLQGQRIDQSAFDRFAVNKAASSSRGFEDSALFEPKRLGFIPKVIFDYNANKLMIQPYVK